MPHPEKNINYLRLLLFCIQINPFILCWVLCFFIIAIYESLLYLYSCKDRAHADILLFIICIYIFRNKLFLKQILRRYQGGG